MGACCSTTARKAVELENGSDSPPRPPTTNAEPHRMVIRMEQRGKPQYWEGKIVSVYDGDTMTVQLLVPSPFEGHGWMSVPLDPTESNSRPIELYLERSLRLRGLDAPEVKNYKSNANGPLEKQAGEMVRDVVTMLVDNRPCRLQAYGNEKFGRMLCEVYPLGLDDIFAYPSQDNSGQFLGSLNEWLLQQKLVKPFDGKNKRPPWTDRELQLIIRRSQQILDRLRTMPSLARTQ